jgi:SPX domain protein involved in polyphosphate accumulation
MTLNKAKNYRYERKYVFENTCINTVEKIVKLNPFGFREAFPERRINNIYYDTFNLKNYYDNALNKTNRRKIRIRWYSGILTTIKSPILEIKIKKGASGTKLKYQLQDFLLDDITLKNNLPQFDNEAIVPDKILSGIKEQTPILLNTYKRKYYVSFDNKFRFTIDYNIEFYNLRLFNFLQKKETIKNIILELKYNVKYNSQAHIITQNIPYRINTFSKYSQGIEMFYSAMLF